MNKLIESFFALAGAISFLVFLSFLLSWPVYMLWNGCLVDAITGVKEVSWLQAWGLNIMFGLLFKSNTSK